MRKVWLWLALVAVLVAGLGTRYAANSPLFWLASSTGLYQAVRVGLVLVLGLQLMTSPPRHITFRVVAGVFAVLVGWWAVQQTNDFRMALLDSCVFIGSSMVVLATALERNVLDDVLLYKDQHDHKQLKANL